MNDQSKIMIFFLIFLFIIVLYHHYYIQPQQDKKVKEEEIAITFLKANNDEKMKKKILGDLTSISDHQRIPTYDWSNHLPGEQDIRIEDTFSDNNDFSNPDNLSYSKSVPSHTIQNANSLTALVESSVPTLNTQQCWYSKEFECPIKNGSYLQCTNNYITKPNYKNCDCSNRTFEMCPYPYKISENEYYKKIGFNREQNFGKLIV